MTDLLNEMSIALGIPNFIILVCLATTLFILFGSFFCLIIGSRKMFFFGIIPIALGVAVTMFPIYFLIIGIITASCISFITFPKHISYIDRVNMIEAEMYMEHLQQKEVANG